MSGEVKREALEQRIASLEKECALLKEADQKFRSLFDGSMDGLVIVGSEDGRIICVNKGLGTLLGYSEDALIGKSFDVLLPTETSQPQKDMPKELQVCGGVFTQDFMHADGHVRVVDLMATLVPWEEGWSILCTLREASERVQLEMQLRQAQKMEAVGALAGGVAHDLNNILSGLVSYPELLLMDLPEESHLRKPILTIKRSGERAAAIVDDLLKLARRGVSTGEVINLNQIVSAYITSPEYEKLQDYHPRIRVEMQLAETLFPITGSTDHLSKVLANLALNAAEAMPDGGEVIVVTENRHMDGSGNGHVPPEAGDYVVLMVSDSGVAIPSKDLESIFEHFYTNKKMGRCGTGLGMTVVWGTVKDHNGYIDVKSEAGKGSVFTLYFPAIRENPKKVSAA
jgi:two-component system cell cycle sensor histidine kinase/response regulator CckA